MVGKFRGFYFVIDNQPATTIKNSTRATYSSTFSSAEYLHVYTTAYSHLWFSISTMTCVHLKKKLFIDIPCDIGSCNTS